MVGLEPSARTRCCYLLFASPHTVKGASADRCFSPLMNTVQTLCSALRFTVCNHHVLSKAEGFALLALQVRAKRSNPSGTALRLSGESCQSSAGRERDSATLGSTRRQMTTNSGRGYSESQGENCARGMVRGFL